jgi:hypothetical protein
MAETLNRSGVETYYVHLGRKEIGHDSTQFHYGDCNESWYLSSRFEKIYDNPGEIIHCLRQLKSDYHITHCLATGTEAYYLKRAGINYHYWSFGSDLDYKCFFKTSFKNFWMFLRFIRHPLRVSAERERARESFRESESVMLSPYQIKAFRKIFPDKNKFFFPHCLKTAEDTALFQQKEVNKKSICHTIQADRYFFSSTRHCWEGYWKRMPDYKGNEVILKSYAKYLSFVKPDHSKLVLVKKGPDIEGSKELSKRLGIENRIIWLDEMRRDALDQYYQGADLCFGHFGTPVLTYAVLEALRNGTVTISFSNKHEAGLPFYNEPPPIFNSKSPEAIAKFMVDILSDQASFDKQSYQSWSWVKENCSEKKFVESILNLFKNRPSTVRNDRKE